MGFFPHAIVVGKLIKKQTAGSRSEVGDLGACWRYCRGLEEPLKPGCHQVPSAMPEDWSLCGGAVCNQLEQKRGLGRGV